MRISLKIRALDAGKRVSPPLRAWVIRRSWMMRATVFSHLEFHPAVHRLGACRGGCNRAVQRVALRGPQSGLWTSSLFLYLTLCLEKLFLHLFAKRLVASLGSLLGRGVGTERALPRSRPRKWLLSHLPVTWPWVSHLGGPLQASGFLFVLTIRGFGSC